MSQIELRMMLYKYGTVMKKHDCSNKIAAASAFAIRYLAFYYCTLTSDPQTHKITSSTNLA